MHTKPGLHVCFEAATTVRRLGDPWRYAADVVARICRSVPSPPSPIRHAGAGSVLTTRSGQARKTGNARGADHTQRDAMKAPDRVTGLSLEWTGRHHSLQGDFGDLSTHTVTYETETTCYVTAAGKLVGEATYVYRRLDEQVGICIYKPDVWQGRTDAVLHAIFNFHEMTDRAVVTSNEEPFAAADGRIRSVPTPPRPTA